MRTGLQIWDRYEGREEYLRGQHKVKEFEMTGGGPSTTACHSNNDLDPSSQVIKGSSKGRQIVVKGNYGSLPLGFRGTGGPRRGALGTAGGFFFALDALVDFFSVDCNLFRRVDPDTNLVTLHAQNGDSDVIANHHGFTDASCQNKHRLLLAFSSVDESQLGGIIMPPIPFNC